MDETLATSEIEAFVLDAVREFVAEPDLVRREATVEEVDIDSLDIVELGQLVQERYGVILERQEFEGVETLGDVIDIVVKQVKA